MKVSSSEAMKPEILRRGSRRFHAICGAESACGAGKLQNIKHGSRY
ncbi:hypothetical protein ACG04Q_02165 [Roseateles sp. DXS20W]|uniref:Uncharacterized protein n=1 Tax=Pelomonas lactea TaxID=3299030 RepID=A0ABW7GEK2_9BURK